MPLCKRLPCAKSVVEVKYCDWGGVFDSGLFFFFLPYSYNIIYCIAVPRNYCRLFDFYIDLLLSMYPTFKKMNVFLSKLFKMFQKLQSLLLFAF